ncbi:MAG: glutathione S-transferase family protein [Deltaproteobacteria bacterium]|nr:glutathione S-transferase family protein [Deltaproteobacteria bacterium]
MKLYWYWSFNPQKCRLALEELGIPYERIEVDLFKREQREPPFRALNPNGKVPLLDDDGFLLWESNAILTYLGERESRLWPQDAQGRGNAARWLFYETSTLAERIGTVWFSETVLRRAGRNVDDAAIEKARADLVRPIDIINTNLTAHAWMLGNAFTLVDCCYGAVLAALDAGGFDFAPFPAVRRFLSAVRARAAFVASEFVY